MSVITEQIDKIVRAIIEFIEDLWDSLFGWAKHKW